MDKSRVCREDDVTPEAASELIRSAKAGDRRAFEIVMRPLFGPAYRLAYGMLHAREEAEDAVQEGALRAWTRLESLREGTDVKPWFLAIVANQCRTTLRSRWWSVLRVPSPHRDAYRGTDHVARDLDLRRALKRLPHGDRLALVLRYYLDMPFEEMASVLGVSVQAARSRTHRAVRRLRPDVAVEVAD